MINQDRLWQQVAAFRFDKAQSAFPFSQRLARENGWSVGFARRVVEEYRRFIYLVMRAGHPVTPSEAVDQAWHLHLVYTRSYWDDLCQDVLGKPLHHGPTEGGKAENDKFHDWYQLTLESYQRCFGCRPPADIWPSAQERFAPDNLFQWVNHKDTFLLPKRSLKKALTAVSAVSLAAALVACSNKSNDDPGTVFLAILLLVLLTVAIQVINSRAPRSSNKKTDHHSGGCSAGSGGCSSGHSGCGSHHNGSGCSSDSGSSGCSSSGCGGGGCGGGGD